MRERCELLGYIYSIINKINNKSYIGKCNDINKRFKEHKRKLNSNKHHNQHLQFSWNKYGENNFEFVEILSDINKNDMNNYEILFIKLFNTTNDVYGYNLTNGGDGVLGFHHSEELKNNRRVPREEFQGENHPFYNHKHDVETKKIISEKAKINNKGRKLSDYTKKKISDKMKNNKNSYKNKTLDISQSEVLSI